MVYKPGEKIDGAIKAIEKELLKTKIPIKLVDWCKKNKKFLLVTLGYVDLASARNSIALKLKRDPACAQIVIGSFHWINLKKQKGKASG